MKIDALSPKLAHIPGKMEKNRQPEPEQQDSAVEQTTEQPSQMQEDLKGVLKLLSEGHFKGVADLRLRIVHNDALQGVELPELSEPKGNGKAYEKFLAIYNELKAAPLEENPSEQPVSQEDILPVLPEEEIITEPIIDPVDEIIAQPEEEPTAPTEEPIVIDLGMENSIFDIPLPVINTEPIEPLDILI